MLWIRISSTRPSRMPITCTFFPANLSAFCWSSKWYHTLLTSSLKTKKRSSCKRSSLRISEAGPWGRTAVGLRSLQPLTSRLGGIFGLADATTVHNAKPSTTTTANQCFMFSPCRLRARSPASKEHGPCQISGTMSKSARRLHECRILCNGQNMPDSEKTYLRAVVGKRGEELLPAG